MHFYENRFYWLFLTLTPIGLASTLSANTASLAQFTGALIDFNTLSCLGVFILAFTALFYSQTKFGLALNSMLCQTGLAALVTAAAIFNHLFLATPETTTTGQGIGRFILLWLIPLGYFAFWWTSARGKHIKFSNTFSITFVFILLLVFWLLLGHLSQVYPYPFLNALQYSYPVAILSGLLASIAIWFIAIVYWALAKFTTPLYV